MVRLLLRKRIAQPLDRAAAGQMAVLVVDFLQIVQIEQQQGEAAARAARTLDFVFEHFQQPAMVRQARQASPKPPSG